MRSGLSRAEKNEQTRGLLLEAARELFLERGFHGASLDAISQAAGFSKGAVYSQFDSKADVFLALLSRRIDTRIGQIRSVLGDGSLQDEAQAVARQWATILETDLPWTLLVIEFRVHAARDPELNARYIRLHERFVGAIAEALAPAFAKSGVTVPLVDLVVAQMALATGASLEQAAGHRFSDEVAAVLAAAFVNEEHRGDK